MLISCVLLVSVVNCLHRRSAPGHGAMVRGVMAAVSGRFLAHEIRMARNPKMPAAVLLLAIRREGWPTLRPIE